MSLLLPIIIAGLLVGIDQWTKYLTVSHLKDQADISIIDGIFELTYVENRGASFGMLQNQVWLFVLFTTIVIAIMIYLYVKMSKDKLYRPLKFVMVMLFAGAVGNFIDRIRIGFVVDMLHFYWFEFPVFNFADILVVVSCILLVLLMLFHYKEEDLELKRLLGAKRDEE